MVTKDPQFAAAPGLCRSSQARGCSALPPALGQCLENSAFTRTAEIRESPLTGGCKPLPPYQSCSGFIQHVRWGSWEAAKVFVPHRNLVTMNSLAQCYLKGWDNELSFCFFLLLCSEGVSSAKLPVMCSNWNLLLVKPLTSLKSLSRMRGVHTDKATPVLSVAPRSAYTEPGRPRLPTNAILCRHHQSLMAGLSWAPMG